MFISYISYIIYVYIKYIYIYIHNVYMYTYIYNIHIYMYIYCKDHFRFTCPMLEHYDFRIHFSTLTFSFFIIFILNYAIFNLQLIVY